MTLEFEVKGLPKKNYKDDLHPLYLYLKGDVEVRSEVILNHPDVIGFIYLNENVITKAFFTKKDCQFQG